MNNHFSEDKQTDLTEKIREKLLPPAKTSDTIVHLPTPVNDTENKPRTKMRKWPDDQSILPNYNDLIKPLKEVIEKGYRLIRKTDVKGIDYTGYNIGKFERQVFASPKARFTEKFLEQYKEYGINLIDIVLHITFLLGIEQGRRTEHRNHHSIKTLIDTFETYRRSNKDLRYRIDELELQLELTKSNPNLSEIELTELVKTKLNERRKARVQQAKKDLMLDPKNSRCVSEKLKHRASFKAIKSVANDVHRKITLEQWGQYIGDCGWSLEDWFAKCEKDNVSIGFVS